MLRSAQPGFHIGGGGLIQQTDNQRLDPSSPPPYMETVHPHHVNNQSKKQKEKMAKFWTRDSHPRATSCLQDMKALNRDDSSSDDEDEESSSSEDEHNKPSTSKRKALLKRKRPRPEVEIEYEMDEPSAAKVKN